MLTRMVVKQNEQILEMFRREDYTLRLLLCEGERMEKMTDDPQFLALCGT